MDLDGKMCFGQKLSVLIAWDHAKLISHAQNIAGGSASAFQSEGRRQIETAADSYQRQSTIGFIASSSTAAAASGSFQRSFERENRLDDAQSAASSFSRKCQRFTVTRQGREFSDFALAGAETLAFLHNVAAFAAATAAACPVECRASTG